MTDDELFALAARINRIESSMITYRASTDPDDPYTRAGLRAQLDAGLGFHNRPNADQNADIADSPPQL